MPRGRLREQTNMDITLRQVQSLGIATGEMIGSTSLADQLVMQGLLKKVWIGSYALTEAGRKRIGEKR